MSVQSRNAGATPAEMAVSTPGVSAGGLLAALWRAKFWIVLPVIVATALAVLWLSSVTPLYRSTAKLIVENQETAYTRPSATLEERALLDQEAIRSQVQLVLSADLSRRIIAELGLADLPEFNPNSEPSLVSRVFSMIGLTRDGASMTGDDKVLDRFYEHLTVYQVENSRVIAIEFSSRSPELAARVANAVADGYIEMQKAAKREATREASDWLRSQIDSLRTKVDDAERKVETYRTEHGLFATQRTGAAQPQTLSDQQLSELTTQLALARSQKAEAQARARLIQEMLKSGGPIESSEVLNSPLIQGLVSQQVTLRAQIAELSATLGPRHPRMLQLEAQLGDLRRQIREEAETYARATENDAAVAAEREQDLLASIAGLERQAAASNADEVELRALERDAKSQRDLLESLLARYRDATAREDLEALPADARIISRAAPASDPYFPQTLATLLAAFLGSLVLTCGFVITLELVRSVNEYPVGQGLPEPVGVPLVPPRGSVPVFDELEHPPPRISGLAPRIPAKIEINPGFDAVRDRILQRSADDVAHTVLFTSVRSERGMDEHAMQLARSVVAAGRRVVVVDTAFGEDQPADAADALGLADLLSGNAAFEAVIQRDKPSRVHVVPAGHTATDPLILIASDRMNVIVEALRHTYDVVMLLAPAVIRRGEARLLARRADSAVLLTTTAAGVGASRRALDRLHEAGVDDIEVVDINGNGADPRKSAA